MLAGISLNFDSLSTFRGNLHRIVGQRPLVGVIGTGITHVQLERLVSSVVGILAVLVCEGLVFIRGFRNQDVKTCVVVSVQHGGFISY